MSVHVATMVENLRWEGRLQAINVVESERKWAGYIAGKEFLLSLGIDL